MAARSSAGPRGSSLAGGVDREHRSQHDGNDYIADLKNTNDIGVQNRDASRNIEAFRAEHAQHSNADYSPQLKLKRSLQ